jgi:cytochrome oxidase Cu insertion factor (SCO1/SenC/PrrC family)
MSESAPTSSVTPGTLSDDERAAALSAPRAPIPTKFIAWTVAALVVLGLGGTVVEHFFGNVGLPTSHPSTGLSAPTHPGGPLQTGLDAVIGLKAISTAEAPTFTLTDPAGLAWRLRAQRGRIVVLAFYGAGCRDICPVLGAEIKQADALLGARRAAVTFAIVNTDPFALAPSATPPALTRPGLLGETNVTFLTGSLPQLTRVWSAYGVQVRVGTNADQVAHNDVLYFVSARGRLVALATPFASEDHHGRYYLGASETRRFARGLAAATASLNQ